MPEWVSPISAIISGQLFAFALANVKRQEPDDPKGLTKVTRTY
jgi:glucosamine--fructose-6-phosphate aminotransferase (isomerizing)